MDFELNEEQRLLKESVARFVEREYSFESRRTLVMGSGFSEDNWRTFADMGWLLAALPEDCGGLGGGAVENAIIQEEFGKALVIEPFLPVAILAARTLLACNDVEKTQSLIRQLAFGEARPVLAHAEPESFGDIAWVETTAKRDGDGWIVDGGKTSVVGAPFATHFIISARDSGASDDKTGLSLFLLPADIDGLERTDFRMVDNSRASELTLRNVRLGEECLLGTPGGAFAALAVAAAHATTAICAEAVGAMERAIWITRDYLKTRRQFGQPLGNFQALQHRMADMLIELEMSRSQTNRGLAYLNAAPDIRDRAISSMKVQISRSARFVGGQAIQLHGGIGVTEEYEIGHYFKRLTVIDNTFGTAAPHLERMAKLDRHRTYADTAELTVG